MAARFVHGVGRRPGIVAQNDTSMLAGDLKSRATAPYPR